ncbi:hypothetical protein X975_20163, partial [Stegodyphus mimosarum]
MELDRQRSRQKSAPDGNNDTQYHFPDTTNSRRQKVVKQIRRRKTLDETETKGNTNGRSLSIDKGVLKFDSKESEAKKFNEQYQ